MSDLTIYEKEVSPIATKALDITITDSASMADAVTLLSTLNQSLDRIVAEKEKITKPLNEALKAERNRWKPMESALSDAIDQVRAKMSSYQTKATKEATEAQERIANRIAPGKGNLSIATAIKKLDAIERPEDAVATDAGLVRFQPIKKFEVIDLTLVPIEYHLADEVAIRAAMRKGIELPGVRYYEEQVPVNFR